VKSTFQREELALSPTGIADATRQRAADAALGAVEQQIGPGSVVSADRADPYTPSS
jgi:hypothetical protein